MCVKDGEMCTHVCRCSKGLSCVPENDCIEDPEAVSVSMLLLLEGCAFFSARDDSVSVSGQSLGVELPKMALTWSVRDLPLLAEKYVPVPACEAHSSFKRKPTQP